jgi:putative sterol carrier protein
MFEIGVPNAHNEVSLTQAAVKSRQAVQIDESVTMSDILNQAVSALNDKLSAADFDSSAKFDIAGEGAIVMDAGGARISDEAADVTLSADAETFQAILEGEMNPTSAFMTGKLSVDGDMGVAMKLASVLA